MEFGVFDKQERPIAVLKPKRLLWILGLLSLLLLIPFFVFLVIIPVLNTGDFGSVWPTTDKRIGDKVFLFIGGWIYLLIFPLSLPSFKNGDYYFFKDRLEIKPFFGFRKRTFYYTEISVMINNHYRMIITNRNLPSWKHPIQRYKIQYWNGFVLAIIPYALKNPEDIQYVLQTLRDKVAQFISTKSLL